MGFVILSHSNNSITHSEMTFKSSKDKRSKSEDLTHLNHGVQRGRKKSKKDSPKVAKI